MALLSTNLEGIWKLNDGNGVTAVDSSGNSRDGTLNNSPTWDTGKLNGGLTFASASSQDISTGWTGVGGTSARSFSVWFKTTSVGTPRLFGYGNTASSGDTVAVGIEAGVLYVRCNGCNGAYGSGFNDGAWHHVVITFADSITMANVKVYVDNTSLTGTFTNGTTSINTNITARNFNIAHYISGAGDYFDGTLDEVIAWSRELTAAEVTILWNGGSGLEYPWIYITSTDQTASRVFQRAAGSNAKTITFAGAYDGTTPTSIEVKIVQDGTSTIVQDWTALTSPTISGGAWSGALSVPCGSTWFNFLARSKDSGGSVLATSSQTSNKWGVGILIAMIGQSNMRKMFDTSSSPPTMNALTRRYNGSWGNVVGNGAIRFSDQLQLTLGCPVGLLDYAVNGSGLVYDDGSGAWNSLTAGQPLPLFLTGLSAVGGDCEFILWHQGEADTKGGTSKAAYKAALDTLYSSLRSTTVRTTSTLKFGVSVLAQFSTAPATDASVSTIRDALIEWGRQTTGGFIAANCIDATLVDTAHYDAPSYEHIGHRYAQSVLYELGLVSYGGIGPFIRKVTRIGAVVTVIINQNGGSGLKETDGSTDGESLTGFDVSDDNFATNLTISSTAFSGSRVIITLSADPGTSVKVRYMYGKAPTITNVTYDNTTPSSDTIGLPLLPIIAGASGEGIMQSRNKRSTSYLPYYFLYQ